MEYLSTRELLQQRAIARRALTRRRRAQHLAECKDLIAKIDAELSRRRDRRLTRAGRDAPQLDQDQPAFGIFDDQFRAEAEIRERWRDLVDRELPGLAPEREWPIAEDHCFARVLLDNACGKPWREVISPPAWRNAPIITLRAAIRLGERMISGEESCDRLERRSRELREKTQRR